MAERARGVVCGVTAYWREHSGRIIVEFIVHTAAAVAGSLILLWLIGTTVGH